MGQMAGNLGNKDVMDPGQADWGDLSGGERGARVFGGAAKGLLNGYSQMQQQNAMMRQGGGAAPIAPVSQPQVSPEMFAPQGGSDMFRTLNGQKPGRTNSWGAPTGNNVNFYGGGQ